MKDSTEDRLVRLICLGETLVLVKQLISIMSLDDLHGLGFNSSRHACFDGDVLVFRIIVVERDRSRCASAQRFHVGEILLVVRLQLRRHARSYDLGVSRRSHGPTEIFWLCRVSSSRDMRKDWRAALESRVNTGCRFLFMGLHNSDSGRNAMESEIGLYGHSAVREQQLDDYGRVFREGSIVCGVRANRR